MKNENYQGREPAISGREIERRYQQLEIKPAELNRVNCYVCVRCKHVTKTIDVHVGVTPMFITCDQCGCQMSSTGYNDIRPDQSPEYEWFIPTLAECKKYKRNAGMIDHIFNGGLDKRRIKEDYCHGMHKYKGEEYPEFIGQNIEVWDDHTDPNAPCYKIRFSVSTEIITNMDDEDIEWI